MNKLALLAIPLLLLGAGCLAQDASENTAPTENEAVSEQTEQGEETATFAEGAYNINTQESTITWVGRNVAKSHNGAISLESGALTVAEDVSGEVVIDMDSIVNYDLENEAINDQLVNHLKSDDFFAVETYPTATFTITDLEQQDREENYLVTGTLTMRGETHDVSFPAQVLEESDQYRLLAQFEIDRSKWGVAYGSETLLGEAADVLIDDMISVGLDIVLERE